MTTNSKIPLSELTQEYAILSIIALTNGRIDSPEHDILLFKKQNYIWMV